MFLDVIMEVYISRPPDFSGHKQPSCERVVSASVGLAERSDRLLGGMYKVPGRQQQSCASSPPACIPLWMRWMHGCAVVSSHQIPSFSSYLELKHHLKPPASGSRPIRCFLQCQEEAAQKLEMPTKPGHAQISWKPWPLGSLLLGSLLFCSRPTAVQLPGACFHTLTFCRHCQSTGKACQQQLSFQLTALIAVMKQRRRIGSWWDITGCNMVNVGCL